MLLLVLQVTINMDDLGVTPLPGSELDTQQLFAGADIYIVHQHSACQ